MNETDYRKGGESVKKAWFTYKESHPFEAISLVCFAAGYNACINDIIEKVLQENKINCTKEKE